MGRLRARYRPFHGRSVIAPSPAKRGEGWGGGGRSPCSGTKADVLSPSRPSEMQKSGQAISKASALRRVTFFARTKKVTKESAQPVQGLTGCIVARGHFSMRHPCRIEK